MGSIPPGVSLDFKPTYIPKTISEFLGEVSRIRDVSDRISKLDDFVKRLEEEMKKIDAFKRELPLCMLLLVDAIMTLKEQLIRCRTTNIEPILEEFIPIKKSCDEDKKCDVKKEKDNNRDKMNWMSSVRLWSHANTNLSCDEKPKSSAQIKQNGEEDNQKATDDPSQSSENVNAEREFMSFKRSSAVPVATITRRECSKGGLPSAGLSLLTPSCANNPKEELGSSVLSYTTCGGKAGSSSAPSGQSNLHTRSHLQASRKQRRCWSPELHRRFVDALQQLGGSQVATPKQIRELMQVDGLTNDEVKSHLQKYRLHTRRLPAAATVPTNQSLAVLGGLWMHQDQLSESSKPSCSQSGSPQGPLQLVGGGTSITGDECLDEEEDEKSECYSWKNRFPYSGKDDL